MQYREVDPETTTGLNTPLIALPSDSRRLDEDTRRIRRGKSRADKSDDPETVGKFGKIHTSHFLHTAPSLRYRHLFEAMPQGVVFYDSAGVVIEANAAAQRILGLSPDQIRQRTAFDPQWHALTEDGGEFPPDKHPALIALQTGRSVTDVVIGIYDSTDPTGETLRWVSFNAVPEYEDGKRRNPSGAFVILEDITERLQAEIARENSEARLFAVLRARRKDGSEFPIDATISQMGIDGEMFCTAITRDVTERERTARALRENESRLRLAFEIGRFGSWESDLESGKLIAISPACREHLGLPPDIPVTRKRVVQQIHPDDRDRVLATVQESERCGAGMYIVEFRTLGPDGRIRYIKANGMPIRPDASGRATRIIGATLDVTEERQREEELRSRNEEMQAVLDGAPLILWAADIEGRYTLSVGKALEALGRAPNAAVGLDVRDVYRDSPDIVENVTRSLTGEEVSYDTRLGDTHFHVGIRPRYDSSGQFAGVIGVGVDITETAQALEALRQSEARLADAQALAHVGSIEINLLTGERFWSDEMYRICGLDSAVGPPDEAGTRALYHPEDRAGRDQALAALCETGEPVCLDCRIIRPDGEIRWCHLQAKGIYDETGRLIRIAGVVADITERKRLEAAREEALRVAEERADHDPLTGLRNHRVFHRELDIATGRARVQGQPLALAVLDLDNFKFFNEAYGYGVGDEVLQLIAQRLREICDTSTGCTSSEAVTVARFGGDEFAVLFQAPRCFGDSITAGHIEAILQEKLENLEYVPPGLESAIPITVSVGASVYRLDTPVAPGRTAPDSRELMQVAEERLRRAKTGAETEGAAQRVRARFGRRVEGFPMLDALVASVDNKDRYTRRHSEDVLEYSVMIAKELGLDKATLETIAAAALLHDVGKIGIPDAVLRKPGRLTDSEFAAVRQHPVMGAVIVAAVPGLEATLDAIRYHHEAWDGTGYPDRLKGEETPLIARLMAVADAFSAMTTSRPYRRNISRPEAIAILKTGAGTQWDPVCVTAFLKALERCPRP